MIKKWQRHKFISIAGLVILILAFVAMPGLAQLKPIERPIPPINVPTQTAATSGYTTSVSNEVNLGQLTKGTGGGLNPGWLAALQFPSGNYVVSGSATFIRRDYDSKNGTARVECTLTGLDQAAKVEFKLHPPDLEPDPSVAVPFNVAGRGQAVYLKCPWSSPWDMFARDINLNAIRVDQLSRL